MNTGIKVVRNGRCQHKNKAEALIELTKELMNFIDVDIILSTLNIEEVR
jgi:protein subunit release factor A